MVQTLFIGLDGATFTVLDEFTRDRPGEGVVMPFLKSIRERGVAARLRSTRHPLTPPAWVSLMTGRTPGNHGVYDFVRFEDKGDDVYFTLYDARDIRVPTIWELAERAGRSVTGLNFPMMAPPPDIKGNLVPGFVSWKHLRRNTVPSSLYERIKGIEGFDPKELAWDFEREGQIGEPMTERELEDWVTHHLPREDQWFRIAETLLREDNSDLFAVMLDGTDKIQHQCWHVMDPALWREGAADHAPSAHERRLRALVLTYFRRLDGYIEKLVTLAGPEAHLLMASDHGFTGSADVLRINRFLGEKGYLFWHEDDGSEAAKRRAAANFAYLDWSRTLAYCPTPSSNGICIRVADAPGKPGVPPQEYEAFRDRLMADLRGLMNPFTGRPAIRDIMLREDAFPGAAMGEAPDLTLMLDDYGFVSVRNREPVVIRRPTPLGTHHPDGVFFAAGPGVTPGARLDLLSILDITPLMAYTLGMPVPIDFEGRVPAGVFRDDWLAAHPVSWGPGTAALMADPDAGPAMAATPGDDDGEMDDAEREHILDQLRALGYLEG